MLYQEEKKMPNKKELELEQRGLLLDMAGKIDFIFQLPIPVPKKGFLIMKDEAWE